MKVTLWPTLMVTELGLTAPLATVMVAPLGPGPLPDGVVGLPPPPSSLPQAMESMPSERLKAAAASRQVLPVKLRI
jgi:hypothetical protein